ncbi:glycerate kinase II [Escherichia coli]|uniref:Glycerate kinase II n=1 Tax=Escherichia coli TaxID=562 RepID=A0A377B088_ECOLX|nr:glycerate kinase II [Escherichia coli]
MALPATGKTAVIEMAAASGLMLVAPEKRNPLLASSFGTGELIRHALDNDIRHIILGIGAVRRSTAVWAWRRRSVCVSLMPTVRRWRQRW